MRVDRSELPDPLVSTQEELESIRQQLAGDAESRKIELERFKEETLWRLNAMSDRTIEIARSEEDEVAVRLTEDRKKIDARIIEWEARLRDSLYNEDLLDSMAEDVLKRLLPIGNGGEGS